MKTLCVIIEPASGEYVFEVLKRASDCAALVDAPVKFIFSGLSVTVTKHTDLPAMEKRIFDNLSGKENNLASRHSWSDLGLR